MASSIILPCILALVSFLSFLHAQNHSSTINLNSNITAGGPNSSWKSPSGHFEFGFYHLPEDDYYLVGIWFAEIPERTLVWYHNLLVKANSMIPFSSRGHLMLIYPNGDIDQNQIDRENDDSASSAFMQDDGNFVMRDDTSRVVWQSFASPTNTMLPGQTLLEDGALNSKGKGPLNYSNGNFRLLMQNDGNLVLIAYLWSDPAYWYSGTSSTNNDVRLVFDNSSSSLYITKDSINIQNLTNNHPPTPTEDFYHRATIDENGNFHQYAYNHRNGSGWIRVWRAIDDPCRVDAICGVNGLCTSPDNESVHCECIPGFIPFNSTNNASLGCRPETVINYCTQDPSRLNFKLEVLNDTDFQYDSQSDFETLYPADLEACKKYVIDDCNVFAATFNASSSTCFKKRMPLVNARKSSTSKGQKALLKVPNNNDDASGRLQGSKKKSFNVRLFLKVILAISSTLACLFGALAVYYHPLARRLMRRNKFLNASAIGINFREFTFQELHEATSGFSETIGKGSSAKIYSGNLAIDDSRIAIAVKKLGKRIERSDQEFMTELKIIGRTHHKNLVRLLGFCIENSHRLLVYELLQNGALSNFLFGQREKPHWSQRIDMALGITRGLLYLHEECETQIIHCDIKPQNVLLDANYTAKIADFGLSKLLNKEQTRTNTNFRGTIGYIAPEWLRSAPITSKVDVFSFGIMLLEIICCKRHVEQSQESDEEGDEDDTVLAEWVLKCMVSKKLEQLAGHDSEVLSDMKRFEQMVLVGLWCILQIQNLDRQ